MEGNVRISEWISALQEKLEGQEWYQELKSKWEELDPQSRMYLNAAAMVAGVLVVLLFVFSFMWSVHSLKNELADKREILHKIESANEELRSLRTASHIPFGTEGGDWSGYFEQVAGNTGIDKSSLNVSGETSGGSTPLAKEVEFDVSVKHVNIKQVVGYAFNLENGGRPVKLRNMVVTTNEDLSGYMDADFAVSAFNMVSK